MTVTSPSVTPRRDLWHMTFLYGYAILTPEMRKRPPVSRETGPGRGLGAHLMISGKENT
jgi:hypothetical protein